MKLIKNRKFAALVMVVTIVLFSFLGCYRTLVNMAEDANTADPASYSELAEQYNRAIHTFPAKLVAALTGLQPMS